MQQYQPLKDAGSGERDAWLDVVRSLAILLVLVSHSLRFLGEIVPESRRLVYAGFIGVELFFVLSGFLIGGLLCRLARDYSLERVRVFMLRRWLRTLPNYYLFFAVNLILAWLLVRPADLSQAYQYVLFLQNLHNASPGFFGEAWSLSIEEIFYFCFPLLALLLTLILRQRDAYWPMVWLGVGILLFSTLGRLFVATDSTLQWDADIRKVAWLRLDGLMVGVLAAFYRYRHGRLLDQLFVKILLLLVFLFCCWVALTSSNAELSQSYFAKTFLFTMTSLGCLGVIVAGFQIPQPLFLARPASFLAKISFSCYLVNLPVAFFLKKIDLFPAGLNTLFFYFFSLLISWLVYAHWERRFLRFRDRRFANATSHRTPYDNQSFHQKGIQVDG